MGDGLASSQFNDEKSFENISKVKFQIDEANLTISSTDDKKTTVSAQFVGNACQTIFEQQGNTLNIINDKRRGGCFCNYQVSLPKDVEVEGEFGASKMHFKGIDGPMDLRLGSGEMQFENTRSSVSLNIGQGNVIFIPARSESVQVFNLTGGNADLKCFLPQGTTTNRLKKPAYMGNLETSVPASASPNFIITAQFGVGNLTVGYRQSNM